MLSIQEIEARHPCFKSRVLEKPVRKVRNLCSKARDWSAFPPPYQYEHRSTFNIRQELGLAKECARRNNAEVNRVARMSNVLVSPHACYLVRYTVVKQYHCESNCMNRWVEYRSVIRFTLGRYDVQYQPWDYAMRW